VNDGYAYIVGNYFHDYIEQLFGFAVKDRRFGDFLNQVIEGPATSVDSS